MSKNLVLSLICKLHFDGSFTHAEIPLGFDDISLWLGIMAIIMLATSETINPYHGRIKLYIKRNRLRRVAFIVGILFLSTIIIKVSQLILNM